MLPSGAACSVFWWAPPRAALCPGPNGQLPTSAWEGRGGRSAVTAWCAFRAATMLWCLAAKDPSAARPVETEGPDDRGAVAGVAALGTCGAGAAAFVAWLAACSFVATEA